VRAEQSGASPTQEAPTDLTSSATVELTPGFRSRGTRILSQLLFAPWAGVLIALVILCVGLTFYTSSFLTTSNIFGNVALYFSWIAIAGFGEAIVMIGGGLDLSVGSTMGLTGMVSTLALVHGSSVEVALLEGLGTGVAVGLVNGLVVTRIGLNPFIATLGTLSAIRGLTYGLVQGAIETPQSNGAGHAFTNLGAGTIGEVPYPVIIMLGIGILCTLFLNVTPWGRYVYAIGGNQQTSRMLGLHVDRMKVLMYVISGVLAAVGGILLAAQAGSALPDAATGYELDIIAAVIIGGTSLAGGRGTVPGVLIGAAFLGVIQNGIILAGLASYWQQLIVGIVIVLAASIDILRRRLSVF